MREHSTKYLCIESYMLLSYKDHIKLKTQSRQKTQEDETVVFQKSRYKILTYTSPFEQNDYHTQISHEKEFRSSFKL